MAELMAAEPESDFRAETGVDWAEVARLVLTSRAMDELDRTSIITPEMRLALNALTPEDMKASAGQAPEGVSQQDWEFMTPEERALWN